MSALGHWRTYGGDRVAATTKSRAARGEISERFSGGTQRGAGKSCVAQRRRISNDQKHLLVIARSTRLRPTLFVCASKRAHHSRRANAAGIISARKQAALRAVLRSDLRVQRACARPFLPCELPRLSPAFVSRMAFRRLSGASIHGKGLRVGASFSRPLGPDQSIYHERKLSERAPSSRLNKQAGYKTATRKECADKCSALQSIKCCEVRHSAGPSSGFSGLQLR